jgi:murein endopeptidase
MKTKQMQNEAPNLTIADLCEALADGRIPALRGEEYYVMRKSDLRRFVQSSQLRWLQPLPAAVDKLAAAS